jgi:hypothetical protein
MPGLLRQWLSCSQDDAVSEEAPESTLGQHALLQSGGRSRGTWAPLPSPAQRSERYAVTQMDCSSALAREELQMLRREYEETRDQLEKESRLAQSRAKVALRIHAREQGLQRNVQSALARAKRAEEAAHQLRLENAVLRQHCVAAIPGCTETALDAMVVGKVEEREAAQVSLQDTPEERRARWIRLNRNRSRGKSVAVEEEKRKTTQSVGNPYTGKGPQSAEPFVIKSAKSSSSAIKKSLKSKRTAFENISNNAKNKAHCADSEEITLVF